MNGACLGDESSEFEHTRHLWDWPAGQSSNLFGDAFVDFKLSAPEAI
jgi:hypothetical protein